MQFKCTLDTGKVVLLREFKIKDKNVAAETAAIRSGNNPTAFEAYMQDEVLKLLVVEIDGKKMTKSQVEDLDAVFSFSEYQQLLFQVKEMLGQGKKPSVEIVNSTGSN